MDWTECLKIRVVKEASRDNNKIISISENAEEKLKVALSLKDERYYGKLPLLYDVLRELLECLALKRGYKIYNHECYTTFLKEIIKDSYLGDTFDKFRLLRNGINYYGKKITLEEAIETIKRMIEFINKIKNLLEND